jgi:DNA polymerase
MQYLYLDLETFSETSIKCGTHVYAADAEIIVCALAINGGPVTAYDIAKTGYVDIVEVLNEHLARPDITFVIHNSHFDRTVLRHAWGIDIPTSRIHDTMVQAMAHSLPASLGVLGTILGLSEDKAKDKTGKRLINLFCKPLGANRKHRRATSETHPEEWDKFLSYARSDVEAMREIKALMPVVNLTESEHKLWELDQRINDVGMAIDMELVAGAITAIEAEKIVLAEQTLELTGGEVASTTQTAALRLQIFEMFGIDMPDMQMATVEKTIADPSTPPDMIELLQVRLQASSTSTSKYAVLQRGTSADGRLRGTLQFCGAKRTGRWAGRLFQPQNLPRPSLKQPVIDAGISALKTGCAHLTTGNVMELVSSAIRSCIVAPTGKKLVVTDLANIEGRVQSWLAGEEWKLKAFRDYDTIIGIDTEGEPIRLGPDLYKLAYSKSFGIPVDKVTKDNRQVGKVQELALAYEGGAGAFATFAGVYGIDLEDLAQKVLVEADEEVIAKADGFLAWAKKDKRSTYGMSDDAFVACDVLKRLWRAAHPNIHNYWGRIKDACVQALNTRGETYTTLGLRIKAGKNWLLITMPSGRTLCYPSPKLIDGAITYMGEDQFTRKWVRIHTHGGKLFENLCQAVARDIMTENMPTIEAAGYTITLTVHDEIIAEAPDLPEFNAEHLSTLLSAVPSWAPDIPLAAAGFETYRYRKE